MACGTARAGAFEAIRRSSAVLRLLDRFVCFRHLCWQLLKKGGPTPKKFDRAELMTDDAHAVCLNKLWSHCACSVSMCGGVRHQAQPPPTKPCPPLLTTLNLQLTSIVTVTLIFEKCTLMCTTGILNWCVILSRNQHWEVLIYISLVTLPSEIVTSQCHAFIKYNWGEPE